jgi:hypothetical protein
VSDATPTICGSVTEEGYPKKFFDLVVTQAQGFQWTAGEQQQHSQ